MKAVVFPRYGPADVLQLQEVAKPTPKENEVLIRVRAATVTTGDCEIRRFKIAFLFWLPFRIFMGLRKPRGTKILGMELAGEIEAVGNDVDLFSEGDQVFAATGAGFGGNAEYRCLSSTRAISIKPANMTYEEAAAVPIGGLNALHFLRNGNIRSGQQVLIYGSTGSIGTFAVQIAKHFGAEVTAVSSPAGLDLVRSLGADHVNDHTTEDFPENGQTYDVIFDTIGKSPFSRSKRSLNKDGVYLLANPGLPDMVRAVWRSMTGTKKVKIGLANERSQDLVYLRELIEAGNIRTVIDRTYPLEQTAEAHRYVEKGQKLGNVVITVGLDQ